MDSNMTDNENSNSSSERMAGKGNEPIPLRLMVVDENSGDVVMPKCHFFFDGETPSDELRSASSLEISLGADRRSVIDIQQLNMNLEGVEDDDVQAKRLKWEVDVDDKKSGHGEHVSIKVTGDFPENKVANGLAAGTDSLMELLDDYSANLDIIRSLLLSKDTTNLMDELGTLIRDDDDITSPMPSMDLLSSNSHVAHPYIRPKPAETLPQPPPQSSDGETESKMSQVSAGVSLRQSEGGTSMSISKSKKNSSGAPPPLDIPIPPSTPTRPRAFPATPNGVVMSPFRKTTRVQMNSWSPTAVELTRSLSESALARSAAEGGGSPANGNSNVAVPARPAPATATATSSLFPEQRTGLPPRAQGFSQPTIGTVSSSSKAHHGQEFGYGTVVAQIRKGFQVLRAPSGSNLNANININANGTGTGTQNAQGVGVDGGSKSGGLPMNIGRGRGGPVPALRLDGASSSASS